ncbi:hypothetical protein WMY93_003388 [Mugilogobius chulae]|uniref:Aquaporin n=1 Tax=Mugilogobius chulae TaxID=88201 RepID=A0AAW0Q776_9GOBI
MCYCLVFVSPLTDSGSLCAQTVEAVAVALGGGTPLELAHFRTHVRTDAASWSQVFLRAPVCADRASSGRMAAAEVAGAAEGAAGDAEWAAEGPDVALSLALLAAVVLLGDVLRRMLGKILARSGLEAHAAEFVSTLQLCCCTHELRVLSDVGRIERRLAHTLTYVAAVVHGLTFRGAIGNPACTLVHTYHGRLVHGEALRRIACQFAAAAVARAVMPLAWSLGMSVEVACAFAVQTAITHTRTLEEKYRVHAVAAVITTAVYAGGASTGAVFNPALAFSTQFRCDGPTLPEYCLVYWLGPVLGVDAGLRAALGLAGNTDTLQVKTAAVRGLIRATGAKPTRARADQ